MSGYDYDAPRRSSRREYREERYDDRDPRFLDASDLRGHPGRELVPRGREDSDLSIEEIRREFPMPGQGPSYRDTRRARSADPGWDDYDDRRSYYSRDPRDSRDYDRDYDRRSRKAGSIYYEEEREKRMRTISKQEKIIAAIAGAAIAVGGKELYDRHEGKEHGGDVNRNPAVSAALGAAGALAAYQGAGLYNKHAEKEEKKSTMIMHKGRDGQMIKYYEEEEDPKKKDGNKNFLESALAAAGLGGAIKALTGGGGDDDKDRQRDRDGRSETRSRRGSRSRSRSRSPEKKNKIQQAAMASLIAGATEAFRVAKEPGGWKGEKAKRVFTAAAGAATIDAAMSPDKNQKLSLAESVVGGLLSNRVIHGSKKNIEEDKATGRSRSRSRAARDASRDGGGGGVSGLAALATAGLGAFGAKKIMDGRKDDDEDGRSRSRDTRSRSRRPRSRSDSRGGSRSPSRKGGVRARSRSVVDGARRRLARIGIGSGPEDEKDKYSDVGSPRGSIRDSRRRRYSDEYDDDRERRRDSRSRSRGGGGGRRRHDGGSDTDLGDSDDDMKEMKRKRGKQILTIGLASVATIHAAHNVYQSIEKRNARQEAVKDGRLTAEEAKKLKTKAMLQDVASVGIAALGIKGAISEVQEAHEKSKELQEWKQEKALRHERRLSRLERRQAILDRENEEDLYGGGREAGWSRARSRSRPPKDEWAITTTAPRGGGGGGGGRDSRRHEHDDGPRYSDGNPYGSSSEAMSGPPGGYGYDDRRR